MNRMMWTGAAGLVCMAMTAPFSSARALMIAPSPISQRVATADCIVVGKVTGFGDKTVSAAAFPGAKDKQQYQIALVKVETNLRGAKGVKEIRVGFIPPMTPSGPIRRIGGPRNVTFSLNQEGCLFLTKHHEGDFYVAPMYFSFLNKAGNANFEKEVEEIKHCAKLLADPKAGLDSENKKERLLTAGLLIYHYRQRRPGTAAPKTAPIDAKMSKKIMLALADADWNGQPARPGMRQMSPQMMFYQLNVTAKDGWTPPKDFKQFPTEAQKWLKDNAEKYVIQRFVYEKKDKEEKKDK